MRDTAGQLEIWGKGVACEETPCAAACASEGVRDDRRGDTVAARGRGADGAGARSAIGGRCASPIVRGAPDPRFMGVVMGSRSSKATPPQALPLNGDLIDNGTNGAGEARAFNVRCQVLTDSRMVVVIDLATDEARKSAPKRDKSGKAKPWNGNYTLATTGGLWRLPDGMVPGLPDDRRVFLTLTTGVEPVSKHAAKATREDGPRTVANPLKSGLFEDAAQNATDAADAAFGVEADADTSADPFELDAAVLAKIREHAARISDPDKRQLYLATALGLPTA